jgi:hypothetical protein
VLGQVLLHACRLGKVEEQRIGQRVSLNFTAIRPDIGHALATLLLVPQLSVRGRTGLVSAILLLQTLSMSDTFPSNFNLRAQLLDNSTIPVCFSRNMKCHFDCWLLLLVACPGAVSLHAM